MSHATTALALSAGLLFSLRFRGVCGGKRHNAEQWLDNADRCGSRHDRHPHGKRAFLRRGSSENWHSQKQANQRDGFHEQQGTRGQFA